MGSGGWWELGKANRFATMGETNEGKLKTLLMDAGGGKAEELTWANARSEINQLDRSGARHPTKPDKRHVRHESPTAVLSRRLGT